MPGTRSDPWGDGTTAVYHITHVENLAGMVASGVIDCDRSCISAGRNPRSIAYMNLKTKRSGWRVGVAAGGTLADYVPFYYAPRSPMLYAIHGGYVPGHDGGQEPVVHLVMRAEEIAAPGTFVVTNGHAATPLTTQFDTMDALDEIDWNIMRTKYWRDTDDDGDRKRRRQAEFLVHQQVPFSAVRIIGVRSEAIADAAQQAIAAMTAPPRVIVRPSWYY